MSPGALAGKRPLTYLSRVGEGGWRVHPATLEHYPFERVETWRVIFEAARISRSTFDEAAARLRHAGFRHVKGGHGYMHSVWHHINSSESVWLWNKV